MNTADAISALFELVKDINLALRDNGLSSAMCQEALDSFHELTDVLGLLYERKQEAGDDDAQIEALIEARTQARKEKNWAESDRIRDELKAMGIVLEDTAQGVRWHRA